MPAGYPETTGSVTAEERRTTQMERTRNRICPIIRDNTHLELPAHEKDVPCSADWQSAVSQVGNLRYSRLPIGATTSGGRYGWFR